jgi:N6-L-threonylcarbamoyladenine synthase
MVYILGIESSCDDTSAAISLDNKILANFIANQEIHKKFGGVVPEFASRAHQQNIVPVVDMVLKEASRKINIPNLKSKLNAVAYTAGPGLLGSLLVGVSFAKAFALALNIPLIEVDHLQAHVIAHFIQNQSSAHEHISTLAHEFPQFPFLCLTVSGGHTQLLQVSDYFDMEILGETLDDAAGECFDKAAKIMGLSYPGGPLIDELAAKGNPNAFTFGKPFVKGLDFSFSGLKTSILYFIRDELKKNPDFIVQNLNDLCASIQKAIVDILLEKLISASKATGIKEIAIAGGVSANSSLRNLLISTSKDLGWNVFIPDINYSTDNAAMIAVTAYYKYIKGDFSPQSSVPYTHSK